jgi:hypothetical protein
MIKQILIPALCTLCTWLPCRECNAQDQPEGITASPPTTALWSGFYLKARFTEKLFYYQENHYRRVSSADNRLDFAGRMGQWYNRAGLVYLFSKNFEVIVGPTLVWNYSPTPDDANTETTFEPRIWHQWLFNLQLGRVKVLHQFRIEHRWKRENNQVGSEYQYTDRWRYKIYFYIPLNKPTMQDKTLFISPSNEFFFEKGKHTLEIFEENRVYTAIGYTYGNWQFFGGHMWTYGPTGRALAQYRQRHIIRLNVMLNLDFRKQQGTERETILLPY